MESVQPRKKPKVGRPPKPSVNLKENEKFFKDIRKGKKKDSPFPDEKTLFTDFKTYAETFLWIRDKRGLVIPLNFTDVQNKLNYRLNAETERGNRRRLILKYRRPGITTLMQAKSFFLTANTENQSAVTLAHDNLSTGKIFEISLLFFNKLAKWAKPYRATESRKELNFKKLGSTFYIGTAGGESFGRGQTLQRVHGSEVAFWPKSTDHASLVAGLLEAASHGEVDFETTANGHGNWFHKTWVGAKEGENSWVPVFLSWKDDAELVIPTDKQLDDLHLTPKEEDLVRTYDLRPEQILWRREKMKSLYDPDMGDNLFHQEYPINDVEAFISSGACFFDTESIQHLTNLCEKPAHTGDSGRLKVYHPPIGGHLYAVGADIGEGVPEGDRTVITVHDIRKSKEVACWVGICSPEEAGRKMAELGTLYNQALLAPEANAYGHSTVNTLLNEVNYPYIYQHEDYQAVRIKDGDAIIPKYGWQTNMKTRPLMLSELRYGVQQGLYHVNDPGFFQECMTFVDNGHGKYEASVGAHDDRIIAHAIVWQARKRMLDLGEMERLTVDTGHRSIAAQWEEI